MQTEKHKCAKSHANEETSSPTSQHVLKALHKRNAANINAASV